MIAPIEEFGDLVQRLFPDSKRSIRCVTLQVTDSCNLCCTYCYQGNKSTNFLDFNTATKFIDMLLAGENPYINFENSMGFILEFIGGEPLLAIDLISEVTIYVLNKLITTNHPWLHNFRISICSNGVMYFDERVQNYFKTFYPWVSFSISIDGNKQLHDSCRVFADGRGSYDLAVTAAKHYMKTYGKIETKMTLAPENVKYTSDAVRNLFDIGYDQVFLNCVFEEGWNIDHAKILYDQLKELSDYIFNNDLHDRIYLSIFDEDGFQPLSLADDDQNWCGGNGKMIAVDYKGDIFPCLRYMESSLGKNVEPIIIGTVKDGIESTKKQCNFVKCLQCMTRSSQSTKECLECPIAKGCAWCSAYNYQYFGELNKRATFICVMHKARALANVYFWNTYYRLTNQNKRMKCHVPREWALEIIPEEEFDYLLSLSE